MYSFSNPTTSKTCQPTKHIPGSCQERKSNLLQTIQTNLEFRQKRKKRIRTIVYQDKHKSQEVEEELLAQTSAMSAELEQVNMMRKL